MALQGNWILTHQWNGIPPYNFRVVFNADGTIKLDGDEGVLGTWTVLGNSSQVALAIANFSSGNASITSYNGNVLGPVMGGQMTGAAMEGGPVSTGVWSASQVTHADAPVGRFRLAR